MIALLLTLLLQAPPPKFEDCHAPNSYQVCLYIDVATPLSTNPTDGFPQRVQYLPRVKVQVNARAWQTTNSAGRVVAYVRKGQSVTVRTDASALLVGVVDANGLPQPHKYVDLIHTWTVSQGNERQMFALKINPQVATLR